jgi:hypothetical protein
MAKAEERKHAHVNEQEKSNEHPLATIVDRLPPGTIAVLESCPQPGYGVHPWIWIAVCVLRRSDIKDPEVLFAVVTEYCSDSGREREIWDAIRNSTDEKLAVRSYQRRWPERDYKLINEVVCAGIGAETLVGTGPVAFGGRKLATEKVVRWMFSQASEGAGLGDDPLICAGTTTRLMRTARLSQWDRSLWNQTFIVPSPMSKIQGINQEGKLSWRCLNNTGERFYLVIECDIRKSEPGEPPGPWDPLADSWAQKGITIAYANGAILWKLNEWLPLVMVVYSGGKSFHGWFACRGVPEEELRKFMRNAVLLGADPMTWTRCQPVRMPEGIRWEDKNPPVRQHVHYFDPKTIEKWRRG